MIRCIASVLAGFAIWTALWLGANAALTAALPSAFGPDGSVRGTGILLVVWALSVVFSLIAGYVLAILAGRAAMRCAWVLGVIQLGVGIGVQAGYWDRMPVWYHLAFLVMLLPGILIGARLRLRRVAAAPGGGAPA